MKFFWCQEFFFVNFDFRNDCKNEFQDNNENYTADLKRGSPLKIDLKAVGTSESHPTAWELISESNFSQN